MQELNGKTAVVLVDTMYNEYELLYPKYRLMEAGAEVLVAGPEAGAVYTSKHGLPERADVAFEDIKPDGVDGLVVPGGYAPDHMRRNRHCLDLVRAICDMGRPVGFICHAGWVLISAGVLQGRKATSFIAIKDDMVNAGADWVDEPVVVDQNFVSSRSPDDLPVFLPALIKAMAG